MRSASLHVCLLRWSRRLGTLSFSHSNKPLLKKLLLDSGGLLLALQPLWSRDDDVDPDRRGRSGTVLSDWCPSPLGGQVSPPRSLYFSLLFECLSALTSGAKPEFGAKDVDGAAERVSPPPSKKARLEDKCPYGSSHFDLLLQLDDGTLVPANREAVAGPEGSQQVGSEYFRGLLRGGFGESLVAGAEEAIRIKGVSAGMLLPVLHYLHGCGLTAECVDGERGGRCQVLDALVLKGLGNPCAEDLEFQTTALGEAMVGASRFLVTQLQTELVDLCVSLLVSRSRQASRTDAARKLVCKAARENPEDNLVHRTSELELMGEERDAPGQRRTKRVQKANRGDMNLDHKTVQSAAASQSDRPASPGEEEPRLKPEVQDWSQSSLAALLPQLYWFSQRYSYAALGRACLGLLLGCRGYAPLLPSSSLAAECLCRLAGEDGCWETLKEDLLGLAAAALSGPEKKAS